jgi:hypothetical protein
MISRAKRIAQCGRTLHKSAPPGAMPGRISLRGRRHRGGWITLDWATLAGGSKKPIAACDWGWIARGVVGEEHGMPMPNGHGHQMPGPVKVRGSRCRHQASRTAGRAWATASADVRSRHGTTAAQHATA